MARCIPRILHNNLMRIVLYPGSYHVPMQPRAGLVPTGDWPLSLLPTMLHNTNNFSIYVPLPKYKYFSKI